MSNLMRLSDLQAARPPSAADQVFEALYRQVVTLGLPPGARLSEAEVARAAGVSRQPVRDAFWRLSQLGFLTIRPQRSTEVSAISVRAVQQARFVRTALEIEMVRLAAERFSLVEIATLEALLDDQAAAIAAGDRERFHGLDDEFHRQICVLCGHDYAWTLIREQKAHMDRVRFMSLSFGAQSALDDHVVILEALRAGDVPGSVVAMRTHLSRIEDHLPRIRAEHGEHFRSEG